MQYLSQLFLYLSTNLVNIFGMKSILLALSLLLCLSCNTRNYQMGISGVWPIGFPSSTPAQWTDFYNGIEANADFLGIHSDASTVLPVVQGAVGAGLNVGVVLGWQVADQNLDNVVTALSQIPQVKYICFGNEVDNVTDFDALAITINHLVTLLPQGFTSCTVFQYERSLANPNTAANFAKLNVSYLGITTYPILGGRFDVTQIPTNYYATLAAWTSKPVMITETGWPSQSYPVLGGIPALTSSEQVQSTWLQNLMTMKPAQIKYVSWFMFNDYGPYKSGDPFTSPEQYFQTMGLRTFAGTAKQALGLWNGLFKLTYQAN